MEEGWLQMLEWVSVPSRLGSEPTVHMQVTQDEGVQAECTLAGWYPEPQVEWRDFREQILPSVTNLSASPTTGLWTVVSSMTIPHDRTVGGGPLLLRLQPPTLGEEGG